MNYRILICAIASLALIGCTSMRPMDTGPARLVAELEPGDHLVVYERSGRIVDMTLTEVDGHWLHGTSEERPAAGTITVDIRDVERLEVEKLDPAKSALAGVGIVVVVVPLVILAALAAGGAQGFTYR